MGPDSPLGLGLKMHLQPVDTRHGWLLAFGGRILLLLVRSMVFSAVQQACGASRLSSIKPASTAGDVMVMTMRPLGDSGYSLTWTAGDRVAASRKFKDNDLRKYSQNRLTVPCQPAPPFSKWFLPVHALSNIPALGTDANTIKQSLTHINTSPSRWQSQAYDNDRF